MFWFTEIGIGWSLVAGLVVGLLFHFKVGTGGTTTGGGGFFNGLGSFFSGISRTAWGIVVGAVVFSGLLMALSRFLEISPARVSEEIQKFGWNPLNWGRMGGPVVLFFLCTIVLLFAAQQAAQGRTKIAGWMIGVSIVFGILCLYLPHTAAKILPSENGKPTWNATDTAVEFQLTAVNKRGVAPVVITGATTLALGEPPAQEMKKGGVWGVYTKRFATWWCGDCANPAPRHHASSSAPARRQYEPAVYTKPVPVVEMRPFEFGADGCTVPTRLESNASFYPKGGWVTIHPPLPAKPWDDAPGIRNSQEGIEKPAGTYYVCRQTMDLEGNPLEPGWGIDIWSAFPDK
ncbi:MAG: hypothetical protein WCT29_01700 [Candidatus Paceibacterota bacterium]